MAVRLKSAEDIIALRASGAILSRVLSALREEVRPGITLASLDQKARELLKKEGAHSAFLGYVPEGMTEAYPAAICASVNETVVHGIPGDRRLHEGDILSIDLGVVYRKYVTDGAITVPVGTVSSEAKKLLQVTEDALRAGIKAAKVGSTTGDIGHAVSLCVKKSGLSVIKGLTGHGVGFALHEDPAVPNYGERGRGVELLPGMVIAIEPMVSTGSPFAIAEDDDSFRTKDRSWSAHFEHTVAITEQGTEILTQ